MQFHLPSSYYTTAFVSSDQVVEGKIFVTINSHMDRSDKAPEEVFKVFLITPAGMPVTAPPKGTKGLVAFNDVEVTPQTTGYWLGAIYDRFDKDQHKKINTGIAQLESPNKKARLGATDGIAGLFYADSHIQVSEEAIDLSYKNNIIGISKTGINLQYFNQDRQIAAQLWLNNQRVELSSLGNINIQSNGNLSFRTNNNNFSFTGLIDPQSKNKGEDKYSPAEMFFVKTRSIILNSSKGPTMISGGNMNISMTGGKITGGGGIPGTGPKYTYLVKAIQGPMRIEAGSGDIEIVSNNKLQTDKILITCGNTLLPIKSEIEMKGTLMTLKHQLSPGVEAKIEIGNQNIVMNAFKDIEVKATTGSYKLTATQNIELEAMVDAKIKALKATIEATTELTIKTMMLKLKDATIIDAGPKMVPPKGVGPFCSIPICPLTGVQHTGDVAM